MIYLPDKPLGIVHIQTPFRISFFGGGTDFPDFFNQKCGAVLGVTINRYSYVVLNSLVRLLSKRIKLSYSKLEQVDEQKELEHTIVRSILDKNLELWNGNFLDIHSYADLPSGSGIGSSSAFTVGMLLALNTLKGVYCSPFKLAKEAIRIERYEIGDKGGWQDQILAAYGGFNRIDFYENNFHVKPITIPQEKLKALEDSCLFFFTKTQRSSAKIQENVFNHERVSKNVEYLTKIGDLVNLAEKELYKSNDPTDMVAEFGMLLNETWQLKRRLSSYVSTPEIDDYYERAIKAGAFGGKVSGAGGGGFMFFIVPKKKQSAVINALSDLIPIEINFERYGSHVLFVQHRK